MKATISSKEISVRHSVRPDVRREFLEIDISGWDDVKKLTKKVLKFEGRSFVFSGWNSDTNHCYFFRLLDGSQMTAEIA